MATLAYLIAASLVVPGMLNWALASAPKIAPNDRYNDTQGDGDNCAGYPAAERKPQNSNERPARDLSSDAQSYALYDGCAVFGLGGIAGAIR